MDNQKFEAFALIELFGHQRMAGKVTEATIAGGTFIRVDVPETTKQPAFSRLLNPSAIYAINPISEDAMNSMAKTLNKTPILVWDVRDVVEKERKALGVPHDRDNGEEDWDE